MGTPVATPSLYFVVFPKKVLFLMKKSPCGNVLSHGKLVFCIYAHVCIHFMECATATRGGYPPSGQETPVLATIGGGLPPLSHL